ncbi:MAG TPA: hypothetical protein VN616_12435 [Puia sp.]|nr:hypothetical protein [Puia sp.]
MKAMFVLFLLPLQLFSQDLSGIWVGTIATSQIQMPFELAINKDLTGYSMITFLFKGAEKIAVKKITLIRKDSTFTISDDKLIYNNFEMRSRNIKTFCELSVKMVDSTMVLSGPFHTRTRDLKAGDEDLSSGTITVQKQNIRAQTKLIGKLDSLHLSKTLVFSNPAAAEKDNPAMVPSEKDAPAVSQTIIPAAADIALRKTVVIRAIDFKSDSLTLILYDNGIVDGDTVSVVLNGEVIIPKLGLTEKAYRKVIKIPPAIGDSLQLVMYAENLGTIPPNSGLLIIEDGPDRYEVGFEGDMKKSSAVNLRRKR